MPENDRMAFLFCWSNTGFMVDQADGQAAALALFAASDYDLLISGIGLADGDGWQLLPKLLPTRPSPLRDCGQRVWIRLRTPCPDPAPVGHAVCWDFVVPPHPNTYPEMKLLACSVSDEKPIRQWRMARRCPISPKRFWTRLSLLATLMATASLCLWQAGGTLGAIFLSANVVGLVIGGLMFTAHAVDGEHISLYRDRLNVDVQSGFACRRYEFSSRLTRVEVGRGAHEGCYWLRCEQFLLPLGRELPPMARSLAVAEIVAALLECHRDSAPPEIQIPSALSKPPPQAHPMGAEDWPPAHAKDVL